MGLWDFLKKNDDEKSAEDQAGKSEESKGTDDVLHAMDTPEAVPQALKDTLAKIRGEQEPDFVEVELNEDGTPVNPEHAELLETGSVVTDDEATGADGKVSEDDGSQKDDEPAGDDSSDTSKVVVVPSRLVAAGEALGWDTEKIQRIAATDISILEDLASRREDDAKHRQDKDDKDGASDSTEGQAESPALKKLREKLGDEADDVLKTIAAGVKDELKSEFTAVNEFKENHQKEIAIRESHERERIANEVFDMASEKFPEIGKTEKLATNKEGELDLETPEMKVRGEIYANAIMFQKAKNCSFELGLRDALQYYAGGSQQDRAVRQVVKDANANKKRFTVRPNKRKVVKVFKSPKDKAAHIVQEAKRKAGLDV
jgi:hypothetical protein